ncbi:MAG: hypothetical protein ACYC0B_06300 [Gemmatimonadaceae bacterium]
MDFIARTTMANPLKASLDGSAARVRTIADGIARVGANGFRLPEAPGAASEAAEAVDLEAEMTRLADEQLRFDAAARLLQKTYAGLRASMRDR